MQEEATVQRSAGKTSENQLAALSKENSELRERIRSLEDSSKILEVDVSRLTWQLEIRTVALIRAEQRAKSKIGELQETIEALNEEVEAANYKIKQTVQEATHFAQLPAVNQDQVRLYMKEEELQKAKEDLQGLGQMLTEERVELEELRDDHHYLKEKETKAIEYEPLEEWAREELRKRLDSAEAAVRRLQKDLANRDEQIEYLRR